MFHYLGILLQPMVVEMGTSLPGLIDFHQAWSCHYSALLPVLEPSTNSVLLTAWITACATDTRLVVYFVGVNSQLHTAVYDTFYVEK